MSSFSWESDDDFEYEYAGSECSIDDELPRQPGAKKRKQEPTPAGIKPVEGYALSPVSSLHVDDIGGFASAPSKSVRHHQNTFQVEEKHEPLSDGRVGVRFNVETVPRAEPDHLSKPTIDRDEFLNRIAEGAATKVYGKESGFGWREGPTEEIRLEAVSKCPDNIVYVGGQGFFAACLSAFAQHLPLAISPDHIWTLISYAFAKHVDKHAEELRQNFVQHEGKKRLLVIADHLRMSGGDLGPDTGSSAGVWEQTVFSNFSSQIKEHVGSKIHNAIVGNFSTTTPTARAAHEITLMSAMKNYFSYGCCTMCGIPNVTLLGVEADWVALRERAESLGELMTPGFSSVWMPVLLPVLDEFLSSYRGNVNHGFWQSMVKLRYRGGSGATSQISGWIQILFPYLGSGNLNSDLRPWQEMYFRGPDPDQIPAVLSCAPVDWDYFGTVYDLHFSAGFTGCTQDPTDGTLTPTIGWFVSHDPPCEPKARLEKITAEIVALVKGHAEEANADIIDEDQPWYIRVSLLYQEQKAIHQTLANELRQTEDEIRREEGYGWLSSDEKAELKKKTKVFEAEKLDFESSPSFISADKMIQTLLTQAV